MRVHPILMSAPMVMALLDRRKTQTRRLAKLVPLDGVDLAFSGLSPGHYFGCEHRGVRPPRLVSCTGRHDSGWVLYSRRGDGVWEARTKPLRCPFGVEGDELWVRETWRAEEREHEDVPMVDGTLLPRRRLLPEDREQPRGGRRSPWARNDWVWVVDFKRTS